MSALFEQRIYVGNISGSQKKLEKLKNVLSTYILAHGFLTTERESTPGKFISFTNQSIVTKLYTYFQLHHFMQF